MVSAPGRWWRPTRQTTRPGSSSDVVSGAHHEAVAGIERPIVASREVERDVRCDADQVIRRCLIVDDNERFLAVAQASLERQGLAVVATAKRSVTARPRCDQLNPAQVGGHFERRATEGYV